MKLDLAPRSQKNTRQRYRSFILLFAFLLLFTTIWQLSGTATQPAKADSSFTEEFRATGNYAFIADGIGTRGDPTSGAWTGTAVITLDIPATATIHYARIAWAGRTVEVGGAAIFDADGIMVAVDANPATNIVSTGAGGKRFDQSPWFSRGGEDVRQIHESASALSFIQPGLHTYTISDHEHGTDPLETSNALNYGVGIWLVYEDVSATPGELVVFEGQDSFFRDWPPSRKHHTEVRCANFTADAQPRTANLTHLVSGVDPEADPDPRSNAFWWITGGAVDIQPPPDPEPGLFTGPFVGAIGFIPPAGEYALQSKAGLEWDNFETNGINIPADDIWACFQIESGDSTDLSGLSNIGLPASGQWDFFALKIEAASPTAVTLTSFEIDNIDENQVTLDWETGSEIDNFGFNLYRAPINDFNQAVKIHFEPSAILGGNGSGTAYSYTDMTSTNGIAYYWLEDVDTLGNKFLHNPVSTAGLSHTIIKQYLPLIIEGNE